MSVSLDVTANHRFDQQLRGSITSRLLFCWAQLVGFRYGLLLPTRLGLGMFEYQPVDLAENLGRGCNSKISNPSHDIWVGQGVHARCENE